MVSYHTISTVNLLWTLRLLFVSLLGCTATEQGLEAETRARKVTEEARILTEQVRIRTKSIEQKYAQTQIKETSSVNTGVDISPPQSKTPAVVPVIINTSPTLIESPKPPLRQNLPSERIPLKSQSGVYTILVEINERLLLDFVLDTGASEVHIPVDVVTTLVRTGTVKVPDDFLPGKTYILADGTSVPSPRLTIRSLKIGSHLIRNVPASIGGVQSQLLLGQSFLQHFETWSLDNKQKVLVLGFPSVIPAVPTRR